MKVLRSLTLVVVSQLLSGCSFQSELFIQNRSAIRAILIVVTYKIPPSEFERKEAKMDYVPHICTPKQYRNDNQKTMLTITRRTDSTLSFFIPASSTARIERTANMAYMDHIQEITYDGKHIPIEELIAASKKYRWDYVYRGH